MCLFTGSEVPIYNPRVPMKTATTGTARAQKNYAIRLVCPHGDGDQWLILRNREESLAGIMETEWNFDCPLHGVQRGFPLDARERPAGIVLEIKPQTPAHRKPEQPSPKRFATEARLPKLRRVSVSGLDRNNNTFSQTAYSINISRSGARLHGIGFLTSPGRILELRRLWRKARFRVIWTGKPGTQQANDVGILCVEPQKNFWGLPEPAGKKR